MVSLSTSCKNVPSFRDIHQNTGAGARLRAMQMATLMRPANKIQNEVDTWSDADR